MLQPLPGGRLLVRNGDGIIAVDARGRTIWSEPNVQGAVVNGKTVIFRRSGVVFAVRRDDAGVLWKRPCADARYLAAAGDRVLTMCGDVSLVLRARDGHVLSQRTAHLDVTREGPFSGARSLNDDYVMVAYTFDGAWLGTRFNVVDAHSGAFLWAETDASVLSVSPTALDLTPYPSMLPWASVGTIKRYRLSDGKVLSTQQYAPPPEDDDNGRGSLVLSSAAAYVSTPTMATFRFPLGSHAPELLLKPAPVETLTVGESAFILTGESRPTHGAFYLDRPAGGRFILRPWGHHAGTVSAGWPNRDLKGVPGSGAVALGDRIAIPETGVLRLYDALGHVEMTVQRSCENPELALTRTTLFVRCASQGELGSLAAFPRP